MSTFIAGRAVRRARENQGQCYWCGRSIRKGSRFVVTRELQKAHAKCYEEATDEQ